MAHPAAVPYSTKGVKTPFELGLHHTQITIPEGGEERARDFYVGILGLVEVQKPPELAKRGGMWARSERLEIHLGIETPFRPATKAHPGIIVKDLDELGTHLEASHCEVRWDDDFPEFRRFYADDPFGNRLEFLEPRDIYAGPDQDWSSVFPD